MRFAVCLPLAKMDGQIFSGRSGQLQQQLSAEGRERERETGIKGGARQLAVVRWKLTPRYKITNVEINFINFRCFPLGETGTFSLLD